MPLWTPKVASETSKMVLKRPKMATETPNPPPKIGPNSKLPPKMA